jgi:GT2 family glycosyltransferase
MGSETELTTRLERAGFSAVFLPNSVVNHQIRREQLDKQWLYRRAFRLGGIVTYSEQRPDLPTLFGVPRHFIHKMAKAYVKYILSLFSMNKKLRFERRILLSEIWGTIYWYRRRDAKCLS